MSINSLQGYFIKYNPTLKPTFGSEKSVLIFDRLEYWFTRYQNGFYKFLEPCANPLYREGDSWAEEIGFSRKIFNRAFDLIGVRYKSKTDFLHSPDKFQGKFYAAYYDRKTNRMYFVRNHEKVAALFNTLFGVKSSSPGKRAGGTGGLKGRSCNGQNGRSFAYACSNISKQITTPSSNSSFTQETSQMTEIVEEMKKIWKEEVGEFGIKGFSSSLVHKMVLAFKNLFQGSWERWKTYCRKIASSKFLMGEHPRSSFRAWISWAIEKNTYEKIEAGDYSLGDRKTKEDEKREKAQEDLKILKVEKAKYEAIVQGLERELQEKKGRAVREKIDALTPQEHEGLRQEFEEKMRQEASPQAEDFRLRGWKSKWAEMFYHLFLKEKVSEEIEKAWEKDDGLFEKIEALTKKMTTLENEISFIQMDRRKD